MINFRRQLMGLGFIAGSSIMAMGAAHALNGQSNINVDGGPLGQLEMSGGVAGMGYTVSNNKPSQSGYNSVGTRVNAVIVQLQKTTGVVQFFLEVGGNQGAFDIGLGKPGTIGNTIIGRDSDALDTAYITLAPPGTPLSFSIGDLGSNIGYESGTIWNDVSGITSVINDVEVGNQYGGNVAYSKGPLTAFVQFGDISESHVFNYLEVGGTYNFTPSDQLLLFASTNLGRTGSFAHAEGGGGTSWGSSYMGSCGGGVAGESSAACGGTSNLYVANSTQFEGFYSFAANDSLTLAPEAQYVYTKVDRKIGINKFGSNLGFGLFGDYTFNKTPYSLGGWLVWDKSVGSQNTWYIGPNDETISGSIAPTWQYKYLYARLSGGFVYLLNDKAGDGTTYHVTGTSSRSQFAAVADTGFVF